MADIRLTRDSVSSIQGIAILDEAKAVHELDFFDATNAIGGKVIFDVLLCG